MSQKASSDSFARITALASLCIAVLAIILPYMQQSAQFGAFQEEVLALSLAPETDGPFRLTPHDFGPMGLVVQVSWELTLSNTGNRNLSIISYSLSSGPKPDYQIYTGIDGGFLASDGSPITFPLALAPGDSRKLFLYVGIMVPPPVRDILQEASKEDGIRTASEARKVLARQNLDIYGNRVDFVEYPGGGYRISVKMDEENAPTFWLKMTTGRGNTFLTSANQYAIPPS